MGSLSLFCVLGVLMLLTNTATALTEAECKLKADVVFILDSSRSIWPPHFYVSLQFVANVTSHFNIAPDGTHVAVVTFSKGAQVEFFLNEMTDDSEALQARILSIDFKSGPRTETYEALGLARDVVFSRKFGARRDVPHIIVIVTDGDSSNRGLTKREADLVRKKGIQVFVIGIGHYLDPEQLAEMATEDSPTYVHSVSSFDTLETAMPNLIPAACQVTTTALPPKKFTEPTPAPTTPRPTTPEVVISEETKKVCSSKKADVVFVLDKSSSITTKHFRTQLNFVNDIMGEFNINKDHTHVSVVTFDYSPKVEFYLNKYYTKSAVRQAVVDIEYTAGSTNTFLALEKVYTEVLTTEHGARDGVAKVVIVITDGKSSNEEETKHWADVLKGQKTGAYVFAIGVGNDTDRTELESIGSQPAADYVFSVDGYNALNTIKDILAFKACDVPSGDFFARCKHRTKPADVMFFTDFSHAGGREVLTTTNLIKEVAGGVMTVEGMVRVGHVSSECPAVPDVHMSQSATAGQFAMALDKREKKNKGIAKLLSRGRVQLTSTRKGARRGVRRVAVVLVHGPISDLKEATREVMRAKFKANRPGVRFVFVGMTDRAVKGQLQMLGAERNPNDVSLLMSDGWKKTVQWQDVLTKVCEALEKP